MAVCQNLVPLVNIKIAGKWMFIPLKMVLIGIDPYPYINISSVFISHQPTIFTNTYKPSSAKGCVQYPLSHGKMPASIILNRLMHGIVGTHITHI